MKRMEVVMRDKMVQQLQKSVNEASSDISKMKIDLTAYEKQCSNLTRSLATAERALKHNEVYRCIISNVIDGKG
jgi:septal ring factor EnvC (AmiA/AmiB activator)